MSKHYSTKNTIPAPIKVDTIPEKAQWLAGEGAGSWFFITETIEKNVFSIVRYSPKGKIECEGVFSCTNASNFNISEVYLFTHLSHCKTVNIVQKGIIFTFERN